MIPSIEVESIEGRIEYSPLHVAGARTLPAASHGVAMVSHRSIVSGGWEESGDSDSQSPTMKKSSQS